ncbi:MAG: HAD-IIB family hydrolase [Nitrospirae bacterium]|nr:HAD-IIB family hydrolase [Nitrospirota bacterium]
MAQLVVFTDLDGSLLDSTTYSFEAAKEALDALRARGIPLVLASSKTRMEIEPIRFRLEHVHPFIVENGGGVVIPKGYFDFPVPRAQVRGTFQVIELGAPCARLRAALKEIEQTLGCRLRGFGDMSVEEIAKRTGLSHSEAVLAKQREYDEPFVIEGSATLAGDVQRLAEARGLRCTEGGRFSHLMGDSDKGKACHVLIDCYRRRQDHAGDGLVTVGIGDSLNDLPLLAAVDRPILVQKPDGSYDPEVQLPNLIRAPGVGPAGWNRAILGLLKTAGP